MITELVTFRGFPHWLTRKDKGEESILTMDHDQSINIGDGFTFHLKPVMQQPGDEPLPPNIEPLNYFKVVEVLESRPSKGNYGNSPPPTHYKLRCIKTKDEVDTNQIQYSTSYAEA